ncbi:MAG: hypothetical protein IJM54_00710 [Thermoguttaceae bacterium]|nr:hypothetical protein [Thermoguttaceae bacterium]
MKTKLFFFLTASLTLITSSALKGEEPVPESSYVEQLRQTADKMEAFPVDLIAFEGPISFFNKELQNPSVSIREEIDSQSFKLFYDFCQLALDATSEDVDACVDYLPRATAKEKALILTVLYIYAYPWEELRMITDRRNQRRDEQGRFRSWFSLQFPCDVFDLSTRENNQRNENDSERLRSIVAQFQDDEDVAFPGIEIKRDNPYRPSRNVVDWIEKREDVAASVSLLDAGSSAELLNLPSRKRLIDEIRQKRLDSCATFISDVLYVTYWEDLRNGVAYSYSNPTPMNTSEKPKTLGQISRQLLESWDPPQISDGSEIRERFVFWSRVVMEILR